MGTIGIRISEEQEEVLKKMTEETGNTKSEQVRIAMDKYLELYETVKAGNILAITPSGDIKYLKEVIAELESMRQEAKTSKGLVNRLINVYEFELIRKMQEAHPEEEGLFDLE